MKIEIPIPAELYDRYDKLSPEEKQYCKDYVIAELYSYYPHPLFEAYLRGVAD